MFGLLAAATLSAITPVLPGNDGAEWIEPQDYPPMALRNNESGYTAFTVIVGADGKVQRCEVTETSGFPDLDKQTCAVVIQRARFSPATDSKGSPTVGTYTDFGGWYTADALTQMAAFKRMHPLPEIGVQLKVNRLPEGARKSVTIHVGLEVSADDRVLGCGPAPSPWAKALGKIACDQASRMAAQHISDAQGDAISSIQDVPVNFRVD